MNRHDPPHHSARRQVDESLTSILPALVSAEMELAETST